MKIVVTGAAGFLGSHLCRRLLSEGHTVIGVDNMSCGFKENMTDFLENPNFHLIVNDVQYLDSLEISFKFGFKKVDIVFHLAARGELYYCRNYPDEAIKNNVNGTLQVLKVAEKLNCDHFVFADTSAEYDNVPHEIKVNDYPTYPTQEWMSPDHFPPKGIYSISKMCAAQFVRVNKMPSTIFRYFNVYGPSLNIQRDIPPCIGGFAAKMLKKESPIIYGNGSKRRDFIYVDDVIDVHMKVINYRYHLGQRKSETFNVGTGINYSIKNIYDLVSTDIFGSNKQDWILPTYAEDQENEAQETLADISKTSFYFDWKTKTNIKDGIHITIQSIAKQLGVSY